MAESHNIMPTVTRLSRWHTKIFLAYNSHTARIVFHSVNSGQVTIVTTVTLPHYIRRSRVLYVSNGFVIVPNGHATRILSAIREFNATHGDKLLDF